MNITDARKIIEQANREALANPAREVAKEIMFELLYNLNSKQLAIDAMYHLPEFSPIKPSEIAAQLEQISGMFLEQLV